MPQVIFKEPDGEQSKEWKNKMTIEMTASLLLSELAAATNIIEPLRNGVRLIDIEISAASDRPIAIFSYDNGKKATLGLGSAEHGITGFAKDGVIIAFARTDETIAQALGLNFSSKEQLDAAALQLIPNIERMTPADIKHCVGPLIDMAFLDAAPRYEDIIPSLSGEDAIAKASSWTPADRYADHAKESQAQRFAEAKTKTESSRDPNYIPAWGVKAAAAATAPTPRGRVPLGRNARR